jgi:hypothetical protein
MGIDRGRLDYAFGLVWAMLLAPPAVAVHAAHRSSWLVLIPVVPVLGFFLGWLMVQYRHSDFIGTQKQSWLTVHQRQSWAKRVRLIAGWLWLETLAVFAITAAFRGDILFLAAAGLIAAAVSQVTVLLTWYRWEKELTTDGWRW